MLIKVVASGPGGVLPSSNYILTHKEEKEKERDFPFSLQKNTPSSSVMYIFKEKHVGNHGPFNLHFPPIRDRSMPLKR